ncbi:MAG TPA: methyltransferase [Candidatus Aminicenantes bacterium]|nr:methyltransferase [Acidobacteriota bacterium]HOI44618.1 methyltransferase [Candidatus Aminicenantes bacterium]
MKKSPPAAEEETLDTFYHGRVRILQKKKGYRFSVDAPLLADFIRVRRGDDVLELGTGSGIIALLLSAKPFRHLTALEIQESLADLARRNVAMNGLEERITVVREDFRTFAAGRAYDVVFSNPPYIRGRGGQLSPTAEKAIAKHEIACDIFDIMRKTREFLKDGGRAYFIYPEKRRVDFSEALQKNGLGAAVVRRVRPRADATPNLFLIECRKGSPETRVLPDFLLYDEAGRYTPEAEEIFRGRIS